MRKLIGIIVVFIIILILVTIFSFLRGFGVLDDIGSKVFSEYGFFGTIIFYSFVGGVFISITSWAVKTSWRGITLEKNARTKEKEIQIEDVSLANTVVNHTQDITPKANKYFNTCSQIKHNDIILDNDTNINKLSENDIYEKVMLEIEEDKKIKSTWAKAFAQTNGYENQAKALYINLRVEEIKKLKEKKMKTLLVQQEEHKEKIKKDIEDRKNNAQKKLNKIEIDNIPDYTKIEMDKIPDNNDRILAILKNIRKK